MKIIFACLTYFFSNFLFSQELGQYIDENNQNSIIEYIFYNRYIILILVISILLYRIITTSINIFKLNMILINQPLKKIDWQYYTGYFMILFLLSGIFLSLYQFKFYGLDLWYSSATLHGQYYDFLFLIVTLLVLIVFFITHILLFYFIHKYKKNHNRKASYITHSNKLEIYWTSITSLILLLTVIYGNVIWNKIVINNPNKKDNNSIIIELTGEQFKWTARYAGYDGVLGNRSFRNIHDKNILGIDFNDKYALDDIVTNEIVLPVNKSIKMLISSKDVIHSAYIPEFRLQMNAVPGMYTSFTFTPIITTNEMRLKKNDENFDYILFCNKICGASHFNMWIRVTVLTENNYNNWIDRQTTFYQTINSI
ncbi:MAG: cytochrome c oxidase subunit II [Bacteroides sp.]|nr:MAG: cytochrome c oxidase subunit II [Bacteroides sp.]